MRLPSPITKPRRRARRRSHGWRRVIRFISLVLLWGIAVAGSVIAVGAPMQAKDRQWLDHVASAHHQSVLAVLVVLLLLVALHRRRWPALAGAVLLLAITTAQYLCIPIAPSASPDNGVSLRLMTLNARGDRDTRPGISAVIEQQQPDVIVMQEATQYMMRLSEQLAPVYPHQLKPDVRYGWTTMLLSRYPIEPIDVAPGGRWSTPSQAALQSAVIATPDGRILVGTCHLIRGIEQGWKWPAGNNAAAVMPARLAERAGALGVPAVLAGDFNGGPMSRRGRNVRKDGVWKLARRPGPWRGTWPGWLPIPLRVQPDHVYVTEGLGVVRCRVGPDTGSDHRPVIVDLRVLTPEP
ncbi:MAG: endonuclease/exonuclease/phosphatase family protein [Phycisphaerales bacterium]|nr:endonuclease/exonuclease/phosphatase family protein [Phycisphaerales bacterium]